MTSTKNQPVETIRDGSLSAVIWANPGKTGTRYSVELTRSYKDDQDQWQSTSYLSNGGILRSCRLLNMAYDRIIALRQQKKE